MRTSSLPIWDGAAYAANTAHHRHYDDAFLAVTPLAPTDRVLDLGCGSGDFTARVAELVGDGEVVGMDAQPSMLEAARRIARPNQRFVLGPLQQLRALFGDPAERPAGHPVERGGFDVVFSRAVLHWVPAADLPAVYAEAARLVRPGGWFRVECGGAGNIIDTQAVLDGISAAYGGPQGPWTFLDAGEAFALVEAAGLDPETGGRGFVRTYGQRRRFDRATFTGWLQSQCLQAYTIGMEAGTAAAFTTEVLDRVAELRHPDGTWDQTFVRLDLLAARPV
jgi:SAM-dependent methyltransferase